MKAGLLLIGVAAIALSQAVPPQNLRTIEGTVVETNTAVPIVGAQVSLLPLESGAPRVQATPLASSTTDASGHFGFQNIVPGFYTIHIEHDGYFRPGATSPTSTNLYLDDSLNASTKDAKGLSYALTQGGVISGRVVDAEGQPIANSHDGFTGGL